MSYRLGKAYEYQYKVMVTWHLCLEFSRRTCNEAQACGFSPQRGAWRYKTVA